MYSGVMPGIIFLGRKVWSDKGRAELEAGDVVHESTMLPTGNKAPSALLTLSRVVDTNEAGTVVDEEDCTGEYKTGDNGNSSYVPAVADGAVGKDELFALALRGRHDEHGDLDVILIEKLCDLRARCNPLDNLPAYKIEWP